MARNSSGYHHNWTCLASGESDPAYEKESDAAKDAKTRGHEVVFCGACSKELSQERLGKRSGVDVYHVAPK